MRVVIAMMKHETNTFSPVPTPIERFARGYPLPPRGEEAWVPGWKPDYLHPKTGETGRGMVFTTKDKSGKTPAMAARDLRRTRTLWPVLTVR